MSEERKKELQRELKAKMGCGDVEEGTVDYYDYMDKIIDEHDSDAEKKERLKQEMRAKQGCGDIEELHDTYDFLNQ
jgi:hypothetical protein